MKKLGISAVAATAAIVAAAGGSQQAVATGEEDAVLSRVIAKLDKAHGQDCLRLELVRAESNSEDASRMPKIHFGFPTDPYPGIHLDPELAAEVLEKWKKWDGWVPAYEGGIEWRSKLRYDFGKLPNCADIENRHLRTQLRELIDMLEALVEWIASPKADPNTS